MRADEDVEEEVVIIIIPTIGNDSRPQYLLFNNPIQQAMRGEQVMMPVDWVAGDYTSAEGSIN